jgi:hypothetical protein
MFSIISNVVSLIYSSHPHTEGTHSSSVVWGTMLQAGRSRVRFQMRSLDLLHWPNPSSRTMTLGSTQPLTEMSTRNLPGVKRGWGVRLTTCEPTVCKMWKPRRLTTAWASTACYRYSVTILWLRSKRLWPRYASTNIIILHIIHRHFDTRRFGDWILSPSSGKTYSVGSNR